MNDTTTQDRLLECVTSTPEPATVIFRRYAGIEEWKSLNSSLRAQRSWVGKTLQDLAERGMIECGEGYEGHPIPTFWRDDA